MAYQYELILIGATGGLVRNIIGYLKARMKHRESFNPLKFVAAISWGAIVGVVLTYLEHGRALAFAPLEVVLIAVAGTVIIDELLQAIFLKAKGSGSTALAAAEPAKTK